MEIQKEFFLYELREKVRTKEMCALFLNTISRSKSSSLAKKEDDRHSNLNLRREIQGQMIVCKTLLHSRKHKPFTVELFCLLIKKNK